MSTSITKQGILLADGVEVGENLLVNTLPYAGDGDIALDNRSYITNGWLTPKANTNNITHYIAWGYVDSSFVSGTNFTLSFDIEFSGVTAGTGGTFRIYTQECYNTTAQTSAVGGGGGVTGTNSVWNIDKYAYGAMDLTTAPDDGEYHYSKVGTLTADRTGSVAVIISIRTDYIGSGKYRVKNIKLEKGTTATPWTPAPTDDIYVGDHGFFEGSDKGSIGKGYMEGNEFYEY